MSEISFKVLPFQCVRPLMYERAQELRLISDLNLDLVGGQRISRTSIAADYSIAGDDYLLGVQTGLGVWTLTLPPAQDGRVFVLKDEDGNASVNNIAINTSGAETIDGAAAASLAADYGAILLYSDGSNWFTLPLMTVVGDTHIPGDLTVAGDVVLQNGGDITTTLNGDIRLLPNGTGMTLVGDAGAPGTIGAINDNLFVAGEFECDGRAYLENGATITGGNTIFSSSSVIVESFLRLNNNIQLGLGTSNQSVMRFNTSQTPDALSITTHQATSNNLVICQTSHVGTDFGNLASADPQLVLQSGDNTVPAKRWRARHNQIDAEFNADAGGFLFTCPNAIPTLNANSQMTWWVNEGANQLTFEVQYSTGVQKTGTVALA